MFDATVLLLLRVRSLHGGLHHSNPKKKKNSTVLISTSLPQGRPHPFLRSCANLSNALLIEFDGLA